MVLSDRPRLPGTCSRIPVLARTVATVLSSSFVSPCSCALAARILTKWDDHFDGLPEHTVSALLYYTLAFVSLDPPSGPGCLVVDISDTLERKIESVRCYRSQFPPAKEYVIERVRAFAVQQGMAAGFQAGEWLVSPRALGTRDLMNILFGA